jgi:multisubunit Na+/H+ antiporter MnhE subunit
MSSGPRGMQVVPAVLEVGCWWGASVGIWLLTLSSVTGPELVAAAACGLPCGLAARAGRHAMQASWQPRLRWARWLAALPAAVVADTGRVLMLAIRGLAGDQQPGGLRQVQLPGGERAAVAAGHRALAALAISLTPGTFVLGTDPEENMLLLHSLATGWPQLDRVVSR